MLDMVLGKLFDRMRRDLPVVYVDNPSDIGGVGHSPIHSSGRLNRAQVPHVLAYVDHVLSQRPQEVHCELEIGEDDGGMG